MEFLQLGIITTIFLAIVTLLIVGFAISRMYKRSTREMSLVKTGAGGRKIIMDGGTFVFPILHEITKINMNTIRLEVKRGGNSALITKDRMRVDADIEFYVTVMGTEEGIARAAQTLGERTYDLAALRDMIEGKLVGGLRSVASEMDLDELHENRSNFVQQVLSAVSEDLMKNGLELESVAVVSLDQTKMEGMDENNVFNAVGMQNNAERLAASRKRRAEIEAEADVEVARYKQQAAVLTYQLETTQEEARVERGVKMNELAAKEASESAQFVEASKRDAEVAVLEREKAIAIARQDNEIAVQKKSQEESTARAEADTARAAGARALESIETERQVAIGERRKVLSILEAEEEAEKKATTIRVSAKAELEVAEDRSTAMVRIAEAEASKITILADAALKQKLTEAEGNTAFITSENLISPEVLEMRLGLARLEALPAIVAEMVKPAEKIGTITIHKVDGLSSAASGGEGVASTGSNGSSGGLINQAFDELRHNAFALPAITAIGKSVGVNMEHGLAGLVGSEFMPATYRDAAPAVEPFEDAIAVANSENVVSDEAVSVSDDVTNEGETAKNVKKAAKALK